MWLVALCDLQNVTVVLYKVTDWLLTWLLLLLLPTYKYAIVLVYQLAQVLVLKPPVILWGQFKDSFQSITGQHSAHMPTGSTIKLDLNKAVTTDKLYLSCFSQLFIFYNLSVDRGIRKLLIVYCVTLLGTDDENLIWIRVAFSETVVTGTGFKFTACDLWN